MAKKKKKTIWQKLRSRFLSLVQKTVFSLVRIDKRKVLFDHFDGLDVGCNPGYIAKKLSETHPDLKITWLLSKRNDGHNGDWLSYSGTDFLAKCIALASARVVVFNTLNSMSDWPKKKGQIWIQTGHGSFGIKKIGLDVNFKRKNLIRAEAKKTTFFLSNSAFESRVFKSGFAYKSRQVIEIGHARNDVFFDDALSASVKQRVSSRYGIEGKKLILFAPTHSGNDVDYIAKIDVKGILRALQTRFGGEWVFGLRFHPRTRNKFLKRELSLDNLSGPDIVDLSAHSDMQELLVSSDAMITDYSSGIFDFLLTKRPCLFHLDATMKEELEGALYFDFTETPIPVSFDSATLVRNIEKFDVNAFEKGVDDFLEGAGSLESGKAAEKAANLIKMAAEGTKVFNLRAIYDERKTRNTTDDAAVLPVQSAAE